MNGAEAIIASLEAEGVDLVFGYPGGRRSRFTTRSTTASRSRISSLVTSRVRFTRPTAMRVRRGVLAWPSSRLAWCHEHGDGHRDGLHGQRAARGDHGPGAARRHRHRLVPGVRHPWASPCRWSSTATCCNRPTSSHGRSARRSTSPRPGAPAPCSSTSRRICQRAHDVRVSRRREPAVVQATYRATPSRSNRPCPVSSKQSVPCCTWAAAPCPPARPKS